MDGDTNFLPPNWEQKYDPIKGKYFYMNVYTKATTYDDPRYKILKIPAHVSSESIPMQPIIHGSPQIYPHQPLPAYHAFQNPPSCVPSPQFSVRRHQLEMSPHARSTPHTPKSGIRETSFTDVETMVLNIQKMFPYTHETRIRALLKKYHNREAVVISALQVERHPLTTPGPTPPPTRSFHKAATAAVAALTMNTTTPRSSPIERSASGHSDRSLVTVGPSYGSPCIQPGFRMSPKPLCSSPKSPKMKLRYIKGLFPQAEETMILDVLANVDNNVQKASERLISLGFNKRDMVSANKIALKKKEEEKEERERKLLSSLAKPVKMKSIEEKKKLKIKLQDHFKDIQEKVICMALESVDYSEEKAVKILEIVRAEDVQAKEEIKMEVEEEVKPEKNSSNCSTIEPLPPPPTLPPQIGCMKSSESQATTATIGGPQSPSLLCVPTATSYSSITSYSDGGQLDGHTSKRSKANLKISPSKLTEIVTEIKESENTENRDTANQDVPNDQTKQVLETKKKIKYVGPNPNLRNGPNDELLLADYLTWNGANPENVGNNRKVPSGPDASLLCERKYVPRGAKKELCKGPAGLAKGSMYSLVCN